MKKNNEEYGVWRSTMPEPKFLKLICGKSDGDMLFKVGEILYKILRFIKRLSLFVFLFFGIGAFIVQNVEFLGKLEILNTIFIENKKWLNDVLIMPGLYIFICTLILSKVVRLIFCEWNGFGLFGTLSIVFGIVTIFLTILGMSGKATDTSVMYSFVITLILFLIKVVQNIIYFIGMKIVRFKRKLNMHKFNREREKQLKNKVN